MAAVLTLDEIKGSELIVGLNGRRVRTGTISGIDVASDPDPIVLEKALVVAGMPHLGDIMPSSSLRLQQIGLVGIANDTVKVRLEYSPLLIGDALTSYLLTQGSSSIQEEISIHPVAGPIRLGYKKPGDTTYTIKPQTLIMSVPRELRRLNVTAIQAGDPNDPTVTNKTGMVNSDVWPATYGSLAKGYWYMNRWEKAISKYSGYFQLTAECVSMVVKNWMMQGVITDPATGKYVAPTDASGNLTLASKAAILALQSHDYVYDAIYDETVGACTVGWFDLTSFASAFGFS